MITSVPLLHESRSLQLRRTVPNDASLLFQQGFSQQEFMRLFRLNDAPASEAEVYQNLVRRQQIPAHQETYLELLICHRRYGPIGLCALADHSALHQRAEYLVGLFDSARRRVGYGIEVTLMVLDLAFNAYHLHKVYASTYAYNLPAQTGLVKMGFQLEGQRRDHIFDRASQQFVDLYDYGMTVDNFRQNQRLVPLSQRLLQRDITPLDSSLMLRPKSISSAASGSRILQSI
ncbi:GNAT family protein [Leptolyngbya sp. BC1307]|uniref:GNAT family N-acetyltransferase n=1 Tax=Leptolyngbya sp. BC1307 TaxID=2029589 RepID=UPI000EFB19B8|nr:GNAT family protein [Leptolyngbya sp. BC1307]